MARVGSFFTLALLFGGCLHSTEPSYEEPPLTPASYPEAVARSYCDVLGGCCAAAGLDFAEEACLERIKLVGIVPLGEPCRLSAECAGAQLGGTECSSELGSICVAREAPRPLPGVGELCTDFCAEGAYCDSTFTCAAKIISGSCAESSDSCAAESYCDDTTEECVPKAPDGESCEYGARCSSGGCNDGVCGPFTLASRAACSGTENPI